MWRENIELDKLEDEDVLLQSRSSIDKSADAKTCGYLHLTNKRVIWTQAARATPVLSIPFMEITSKTKKKSKIFILSIFIYKRI